MRTILIGIVVAVCANASVSTEVSCQVTDIQTGALLSTDCNSVYGNVTAEGSATDPSLNPTYPTYTSSSGSVDVSIDVNPDYQGSVSIYADATTSWSFGEQYVITGGTGTGTIYGSWSGDGTDVCVCTSLHYDAATNFFDDRIGETPGNIQFETSFTFGIPIDFFASGFAEVGASDYSNTAFIGAEAVVDHVTNSAGQIVNAQFTPFPEPTPEPSTGLLGLVPFILLIFHITAVQLSELAVADA